MAASFLFQERRGAVNDLKIFISGMLDSEQTKIAINSQLKRISKELKKLNIKVNIDKTVFDTFSMLNNNIEKVARSLHSQQDAIQGVTSATDKETQAINNQISAAQKLEILKRKIIKDGSGEITHQITVRGDKFSQEIEYLKKINDGWQTSKTEEILNPEKLKEAQKNIDNFVNDAVPRLSKLTNTIGDSDNNLQKIVNSLDQLSVHSSKTDFTNINRQIKELENNTKKMLDEAYKANEIFTKDAEALDKAHFMALKEDKARLEAIDKAHYQALKMNREFDIKKAKEAEAIDRAHYQALKTEQERKIALDKQHYLALQQNQKREEDFLYRKAAMEAKIADIRRRFGSDKNVSMALDGLNNQFNNITSVGNYSNALKNVDLELKKITASANTARSNAISLGEAFKTAMIKFPIWMAASTAFFGTIRSLQKAVDVIIEVDKQMTTLKRVMDQDTNFDKMLKGSIELANELGRSIIQINEAMTGFARQGYNEDQVLALTKTATLMTNISELSGEEAMSSLTAAMTIFNIEASRSIEIIDALNEVDEISLPTQQCVA